MRLKRISKYLLLSTVVITSLSANITGKVYKDFDFDGIFNGSDTAVVGVGITAVCSDGSSYNANSGSDGSYILSTPSGVNCRVEVDVSNAGAGAGFIGSSNSSSLISFVDDGVTNDIPLASSATFCQSSPDVAIVGMPGGVNLDKANDGTLFKVALPADNVTNGQDTIVNNRLTLSVAQSTGSIWGLAYKRDTKELFAAAALRRYVPLKDDSQPESSAGAIYKVDTTTNSVTLFATVPNTLSSGATSTIPNRTYGQNEDLDIAQYIGREGLGDLDINEDGTRLYTINLNTKELIEIDALSGTILSTTAIPNPYGTACPNEDVRPWALKVENGKVYVGSVCESKITGNDTFVERYEAPDDTKVTGSLGATVQEFTGASFNVIATTNTLRYLKANPYTSSADSDLKTPNEESQYHTWKYQDDNAIEQTAINNYGVFAAPILTDIEFDNSGNIVLSYTDRWPWIADNPFISNGDVRKLCKNSDGTFTDESSDKVQTNCQTHESKYVAASDDTYYEFYTGDSYFDTNTDTEVSGHPETASGALAQAPGRDNIVAAMVDGTALEEPGSIALYSHTTGEKMSVQAVIKNDNNSIHENQVYFGKAGGLGDIELMCDPMPYLEIGNRIWDDSNKDGIQDPNEGAISNVAVDLVCNGTKIGTATTNSKGEYYFGGKDNLNLNSGQSLTAGANCQLQVALSQSSLNGYVSTIKDVNNNSSDTIDSDGDNGTLVSGSSAIEFTMPKPGYNNHNFDFGFSNAACVGDFVWNDNNKNGIQDAGEEGISGVRVDLIDGSGVVAGSTTTAADGSYQICTTDAGTYSVKFDITTLPQGFTPTIQTTGTTDGSDANVVTGIVENVTLTYNQTNSDIDMGAYTNTVTESICLGDRVWMDNNLNGIQDEDAKYGVRDITVYLLDANGNQAVDVNGQPIEATKTDENGNYKFCNVKPKQDYKIKFEIPKTYNATIQNVGDDALDNDANELGVIDVINPTKDDMSLDMGIYCNCDDYKVNPENSKKLSAPALNFAGLFVMIFAMFGFTRREKRA